MKIAVFYPNSIYSAWSVSEGIVDTLKRMGHETVGYPIDPNAQKLSRAAFPADLNEFDAVLVSGPEHLRVAITALYPTFKGLRVKKLAWMHETVERSDYGRLPIEEIKSLYDRVFTPAAQDEKYGMKFLPFGVDTVMFLKSDDFGVLPPKKQYGAVFIGLLYGPRAEFVKKHGLENLIQFGKCEALSVRRSAEVYAAELRRARVLVNLPSLCRHSVTKIFEGAACGACVVTEKLDDERNVVLKEAVYYNDGNGLKKFLELDSAEDYAHIAEKQRFEIYDHHRLEQRLEIILQN